MHQKPLPISGQILSFEECLVHMTKDFFERRGLVVRRVYFASNQEWPELPTRYGISVSLGPKDKQGWRSYCTWKEPESFVELIKSIKEWRDKVMTDLPSSLF